MNLLIKLKALSEANRLEIVTLLLGKRFCVRALARRLHISEAAVSQHIRVLREAGFLAGAKQGYFMHYEVERKALQGLAEEIIKLLGIKPIGNPQGECSGKPHCQCRTGKEDGSACRRKKK